MFAKSLRSLDPNVRSARAREWTPLHLATFNGHTNAVQALLSIPNIDANARCGSTAGSAESTPLHFAVMKRHLDVARLLLATPDILNSMVGDSAKWTPLHWAVHGQCLEVVRLILKIPGVPLHLRTKGRQSFGEEGLTALQMARTFSKSIYNSQQIINLLMNAESNRDIRCNG